MNPNQVSPLLALFSLFLLFSPSSAHNKSQPSSSSSSSASASGSFGASFKGSFPCVYAFGDSYTDTGNAQALSGHTSAAGSASSHGSASGTAQGQSAGSASGNAQAASGHISAGSTDHVAGNTNNNRLCNGRLVIDFLCDALHLPPLTPYTNTSTTPNSKSSGGVNFAIAGATALPSDSSSSSTGQKGTSSSSTPPLFWKQGAGNLQTQVEWFQRYLQGVECEGKSTSACKDHIENALFWIGAFGVNDYTSTIVTTEPLHPLKRLNQMSVRYIGNLIKTLIDTGAKYIVVQGLPPVGCLPVSISPCGTPTINLDQSGCAPLINSAIKAHNELLQSKITYLQRQHADCKILYADYWSAYMTILTNPERYNFLEPFKACCGAGGGILNFNLSSLCGSQGTSTCSDPSKYINWDGVHLTEAMYKQTTDLFINHGFCQPSFDQLIKLVKSGK